MCLTLPILGDGGIKTFLVVLSVLVLYLPIGCGSYYRRDWVDALVKCPVTSAGTGTLRSANWAVAQSPPSQAS